MANESKHPESPSTEEATAESSSPNKSRFASWCGKTVQYWLAFLLISTLVIHAIGLAYYKINSTRPPVEPSPEISLGDFDFSVDKTAGGRVAAAEFSLYITALEGLDRVARIRLASHKYRVQEEIEALLRQAHSGDFEDPALNDLKRRIREQINQVLGNRVVSDVIVANMKITPAENKESPTAADNTSSPPWHDQSSSYVSQQGSN